MDGKGVEGYVGLRFLKKTHSSLSFVGGNL